MEWWVGEIDGWCLDCEDGVASGLANGWLYVIRVIFG